MSTELKFKQQMDAAKLSSTEGKLAVEMNDIAVMQRETDRKIELTRAIGTSRAQASGSGIAINVGSPLSIIQQQVEQEKTDTDRDRFNTKIANQSARFRAEAKAGQIRGRAYIGLLNSTASAASTATTGGSIK